MMRAEYDFKRDAYVCQEWLNSIEVIMWVVPSHLIEQHGREIPDSCLEEIKLYNRKPNGR
jgi:hypothetical protein